MAVEIGQAYVSIIPSTDGLGKSLMAGMGTPVTTAGARAGGLLSGGIINAVKKAAPVIAVAAVGKAGLDAALTLDDAFDTIRVGTGATGKALEDLKGDFKSVFATVPTDAGSAGTAIADLNTRLGLTGKPLQNMSKQILELSRLTGTDLPTNIAAVTRTFGDWGIAQKDMSSSLDAMFRASQATGISVDQLGSMMVQYGAPLREMGFSFGETAAMLGKFEKEGVNAQLVMGGLKMGLGRMIRAGLDPRKEFDALTKSIETSGLTAENKTKVFEMFGARAGVDMAKAIEEGRFELGELLNTVEGGSETILTAAAETKDFRQSWQQFKNVGTIALEPIGLMIMNVLNPALETVSNLVAGVFDSIGAGASPVEAIGAAIGEAFGPSAAAVFTTVAGVIKDLYDGLVAIGSWISANRTWLEPIAVAVLAMVGAYKAWTIATTVHAAITKGLAAAQAALNVVMAANPIGIIVLAVIGLVAALVYLWKNNETFRTVVTNAWNAVKAAVVKVIDWFRTKPAEAFNKVREGIKTALDKALAFLKKWGPLILTALGGPLAVLLRLVITNWDKIRSTMATAGQKARDAVVNAFGRIKAGVSEKVGAVVAFVKGIPERLLKAMGNLGQKFLGLGRSIVDGLREGLQKKWDGLVTKIRSLADMLPKAVKKLLGIASPSKVFAGFGANIVEGLAEGMTGGVSLVKKAAGTLADATLMPDSVVTGSVTSPAASMGLVPAAGGNNIYITGLEMNPDTIEIAAARGLRTALSGGVYL